MLLSATLNIIASDCDKKFIKSNSELNHTTLFNFIKAKLQADFVTIDSSFEVFHSAFITTISKTVNKEKFIKSEIDSLNSMIGETLLGLPTNHSLFDNIEKLILINRTQIEVFENYYLKLIKNRDFNTLVRIVYVYGLIKYRSFLEGDPLNNLQPIIPDIDKPDNDYQIIQKALYNSLFNWDTLQKTGRFIRPKTEGIALNPTHDFNLLKQFRLEKYNALKISFIAHRNFYDLEITEFELNYHYSLWLFDEIKVVNTWLSDAMPIGVKKITNPISDKIEVLKYQKFINSEIDKTQKLLNQPHQIKQSKDISYFLNNFDDETLKALNIDGFNRSYNKRGYFVIKTDTDEVKVYTSELSLVLCSKTLPAKNLDSKQLTTINGSDYIDTYVEGYKEGRKYFEKEFALPPGTLYGPNAEYYVMNIHANYFHTMHVIGQPGWNYVRNCYPSVISHKIIKEFAYYSGIVSIVEELVKKHPKLFLNFEKCEHSNQTENDENKYTELTIEQIALIYAYRNERISKTNATNIIQKYGYASPDSPDKLLQHYLSNLTPQTRLSPPQPFTSETLNSKIQLLQSISTFLPIQNQPSVLADINTLQTYSTSFLNL